MRRLLVTGFEPFKTFAVNPSWEAARRLPERLGPDVACALLPVDHWPARGRLLSLLVEHRPQAVLLTGLAAGDRFRMEVRARKPAAFASLPGPAELESTLRWAPVAAAIRAVLGRAAGARTALARSTDAGSYVCESTYWTALDYAAALMPGPRVGFLHVPAVSPVFDVERTAACVEAAAEALLASLPPPKPAWVPPALRPRAARTRRNAAATRTSPARKNAGKASAKRPAKAAAGRTKPRPARRAR